MKQGSGYAGDFGNSFQMRAGLEEPDAAHGDAADRKLAIEEVDERDITRDDVWRMSAATISTPSLGYWCFCKLLVTWYISNSLDNTGD